jgi:N4-gp56 family major capsid protein
VSVATFVPEIWSAKLLLNFSRKLVYADLVSRDYEGDLSQAGDTVHINTLGDVTVAEYTAGTTSITPETLATTKQALTVDQAHYFAFEVDDVDKRQMSGNLVGEATKNAGYGFAKTVDEFIVDLYSGVDAGNDLGTVAVTTGDLAYELLLDMRTACAEADIPDAGRWAVVPPWFAGLLLNNEKFVKNEALGSKSADALLNGHIGRAAGFDVYESNSNPLTTTGTDDYLVWCGTPSAIGLVTQINEVEALRSQTHFADVVRGLLLYGAKLLRSDGIVTAAASQT